MFQLPGMQDPFIQVLPGPQFLLGGMQGVGVLIDTNADPTSGVVEWNGDCLGSAYTFPYVVSLILAADEHKTTRAGEAANFALDTATKGLKAGIVGQHVFGAMEGIGNFFDKNSSSSSAATSGKKERSKLIEVHSAIDQHRMVQTIQVPPDAITIVDDSEHLKELDTQAMNKYGATASKVSSSLLFASTTAVYQISMFPYEKQVRQLLNACKVDAAQGLLSAFTPKENMASVMSNFSMEAGVTLFLNLRFEECVSYLQESTIDFRELLQLFPELQPITGLGIDFEPTMVLPKAAGGTLPHNVTDMMSLIRTKRRKIRNKLLQGSGANGSGTGGGGGQEEKYESGSSSSSASPNRLSKQVNQQGYSNNATDEEVALIARQCILKIFLHRRQRMAKERRRRGTAGGGGAGGGGGDGDGGGGGVGVLKCCCQVCP